MAKEDLNPLREALEGVREDFHSTWTDRVRVSQGGSINTPVARLFCAAEACGLLTEDKPRRYRGCDDGPEIMPLTREDTIRLAAVWGDLSEEAASRMFDQAVADGRLVCVTEAPEPKGKLEVAPSKPMPDPAPVYPPDPKEGVDGPWKSPPPAPQDEKKQENDDGPEL